MTSQYAPYTPLPPARSPADPPLPSEQSRIQHETGLKHKGNYERFIRDIYKRGEKDARDKAEEAREMARIEAVSSAQGFTERAANLTSSLRRPHN